MQQLPEKALVSGSVGNERTHMVATTQHLTTSADEMVTADLHLVQTVGEQPAELSVEEQSLLSEAHKSAVSSRRLAWRIITRVRQTWRN